MTVDVRVQTCRLTLRPIDRHDRVLFDKWEAQWQRDGLGNWAAHLR